MLGANFAQSMIHAAACAVSLAVSLIYHHSTSEKRLGTLWASRV